MNPLDFAARVLRDVYGDRLTDPAAPAGPVPVPAPVEPPVPVPAPALNGWRSSVYAVLRPGGVPEWKADWSVTDEDGLREWLVLAELTDLTADRRVSSWEAARTLFAPDAPCAGLYATQTHPEVSSRVSVSPDAHRPAQPLP